jgi:putative transposase
MYDQLAKTLQFCLTKYGGKLVGYVFMPTHLHLLLMIPGKSLAPFMRDFKKYVAQKVCSDLGIYTCPIWEKGYDRLAIVREKVLLVKLQYIHQNPVKAGLVKNPHDWKWSSAAAYLTEADVPLPVFVDWMG